MHLIVVRVGTITHPMTQSVIRMALDLGVKVSVCTTKNQVDLNELFDGRVDIHEIDIDYTKKCGIAGKFMRMFSIRKKLWNEIDSIYEKDSVLWVGHNITIKHLGNRLLKYRYILHLNELNEGIFYWPNMPIFKMNAEKIGNTAGAVVVPEYNRAHITKAWWGLKQLPYIMPNKPYLNSKINRNSEIVHSEEAKEICEKLKDKKIILYQGVISKERKIDEFVKAVGTLGDEYAFVIMSSGIDKIDFELPDNCYLINYIYAPYHLEVTSHAFIGILSYVPEKTSNSVLNSIYCAPNKIYEYSMFGIPMLSNDVPALQSLFAVNNCGICVTENSEQVIVDAIKEIEKNYSIYSSNALNFYESTDNIKTLSDIIDSAKKRYNI